jgi:hypothetical protein
MEFAGRLASFSPSNLLQWADSERKTGVLVVRRSRREKRISFRRGRVVGCRSNLVQETFGRYLIDHGLVRADALARVLAYTRAKNVPTGRAFVDLGVLPASVVEQQLARWIADSVQDLCLWSHGVFVFHDSEPPALPLEVSVAPAGMALEGAHWLDELRRLRARLPDDGVIVRRGPRWPEARLEPFEERIAQAVSGELALGALRACVGGVDFPFLRAVGHLVEQGIVEIAGRGESREQDSREIELESLLGDRDGELPEENRRSRQAAMPIDVIERLVPVWLRPPSPEELVNLTGDLRSFLENFDGHYRLGDLFARGARLLADQTDLLFLHLERGNVALLPEPVAGSHDPGAVGRALRGAGLVPERSEAHGGSPRT